MTGFKEKVKSTIERYQMLHRGDTVVVGISGGADSVALFSVLNELKDDFCISLAGAHVNHGLRGAEALRDERFSEALCKDLGAEFYVLHADVAVLAKEQGISFETCGRQVRYDFFEQVSSEVMKNSKGSGVTIATAHNANDVSETVIYNLSRGSGLKGATGIPPVRYTKKEKITVVRPIIECTRDEILGYLDTLGREYMTDSTNLDDSYARNKIRLHVLPELCGINSGAVSNIARFADSVREDEEFLLSISEKLTEKSRISKGKYSVSAFSDAEPPILRRVLSEIVLSETGVHAEKNHLEATLKAVKSADESIQKLCFKIQLPGGDYLEIKDGLLTVYKAALDGVDDGKGELPEKREYIVEKISIDMYKKSDIHLLENMLDCDKINGKLFFRNRKNGDHFRPYRRKINKSLKSLFNEAHIPVGERDRLSILECDGEIIWIEGFGPAAGYQVTKETKEVLYIHVQ